MTRRLFVCHATADVEAASELVDALENALSFSAGSLWTSSLPGYSAEPNDMPALGAALAGSDVVLALVTQHSVQDAQFHFQLGAGWALGAHTVLFLMDPRAFEALPSALSQASVMRGHEPSQWSELIGDLSVRLGLVPRPGASYAPSITPSSPPPAPKSAPPPAARVPAESEALAARAHDDAIASTAHANRATAGLSAAGTRPTSSATLVEIASASAPYAESANSDSPTLAQIASASAHGGAKAATSAAAIDDAAPAFASATSSPTLNDAAVANASSIAAASSSTHADAHASPASSPTLNDAAIAYASRPITATSSPARAGQTSSPTLDDGAVAHASSTTATSSRAVQDAAVADASPASSPTLTDAIRSAVEQIDAATAHAGPTAAAARAASATGDDAPTLAETAQHDHAPAQVSALAAAADSGQAAPPSAPARRADETPLPAAVAKIANASARPTGATTALNAAAAQIAAAKTHPSTAPSKAPSVPPLPGARPASVPPLPSSAQARSSVPPLPAAVTSSVIVPPPPLPHDEDANEPTTTPKAPIIVLDSLPELGTEQEPTSAKPELTPQPRAAGTYPSVAPQHSYLDELRAISDPADRTPPRYSYVDELEALDPEDYAAAAGGYEALPSDDDEEPETREQRRVPARDEAAASESSTPAEQASDSDVFARLPTCEMALEAGRAVSDCLFNRDEISNLTAELDGPLGGLIESLGASWTELRAEQDLDTWVAVTDHLLQTLPDEVRKLEEWYRVGFELATLHNLAGQLVLDGSDAAAEQHWRGALERFLMRAERAEIGYENLGRVLGLLENLAGPSHERDLTNIPRSLEELRRYAAGADIHTAA